MNFLKNNADFILLGIMILLFVCYFIPEESSNKDYERNRRMIPLIHYR
jgi:hypothetical protein